MPWGEGLLGEAAAAAAAAAEAAALAVVALVLAVPGYPAALQISSSSAPGLQPMALRWAQLCSALEAVAVVLCRARLGRGKGR